MLVALPPGVHQSWGRARRGDKHCPTPHPDSRCARLGGLKGLPAFFLPSAALSSGLRRRCGRNFASPPPERGSQPIQAAAPESRLDGRSEPPASRLGRLNLGRSCPPLRGVPEDHTSLAKHAPASPRPVGVPVHSRGGGGGNFKRSAAKVARGGAPGFYLPLPAKRAPTGGPGPSGTRTGVGCQGRHAHPGRGRRGLAAATEPSSPALPKAPRQRLLLLHGGRAGGRAAPLHRLASGPPPGAIFALRPLEERAAVGGRGTAPLGPAPAASGDGGQAEFCEVRSA